MYMIEAVEAVDCKLLQHAVAANASTQTKNELKSTGANNFSNSSCIQMSAAELCQDFPKKKYGFCGEVLQGWCRGFARVAPANPLHHPYRPVCAGAVLDCALRICRCDFFVY